MDYDQIISTEPGVETYLHTTNEFYASLICKYGFLVSECFYKTTDHVSKINVGFWHRYRRAYGTHTIVFQIKGDTESPKFQDRDKIKQALNEIIKYDEAFAEEDQEFEYLIPVENILGYITENNFYLLKNETI